MKSTFGFEYKLKSMNVLGFKLDTIFDLDQSIDTLCEFFGEDNQDNSLAEQYCPYFGVLWEAGVGLSQHINQLDLKDKRILEIGCGLALPSFVATKLGAKVLATDFHADVPMFLENNQTYNETHFDFKLMNWRDEVDRLKSDIGLFDLVIGSDILYESQHPKEVAKVLIAFLKPGGKIILADPGRAYIQNFVSAMRGLNFPEALTVETVDAKFSPKNKTRDIYIFTFDHA